MLPFGWCGLGTFIVDPPSDEPIMANPVILASELGITEHIFRPVEPSKFRLRTGSVVHVRMQFGRSIPVGLLNRLLGGVRLDAEERVVVLGHGHCGFVSVYELPDVMVDAGITQSMLITGNK